MLCMHEGLKALATRKMHDSRLVCLRQMMSDKGLHSLLSADTASQQWKLVRKAVMPAFSPNNIRRDHLVPKLLKATPPSASEMH